MNELLVMRHAKSDWHVGASDFNRPLNDRGRRAADAMAAWLVDHDLVPDLIVSSSATRTRETVSAVAAACGFALVNVVFADELYLADDFTWRQAIAHHAAAADRLLICGHNPGFDDLVDYLSSSPAELTPSGKLMTTAAIAHFRFPTGIGELSAGSGGLVSLTRPADL